MILSIVGMSCASSPKEDMDGIMVSSPKEDMDGIMVSSPKEDMDGIMVWRMSQYESSTISLQIAFRKWSGRFGEESLIIPILNSPYA